MTVEFFTYSDKNRKDVLEVTNGVNIGFKKKAKYLGGGTREGLSPKSLSTLIVVFWSNTSNAKVTPAECPTSALIWLISSIESSSIISKLMFLRVSLKEAVDLDFPWFGRSTAKIGNCVPSSSSIDFQLVELPPVPWIKRTIPFFLTLDIFFLVSWTLFVSQYQLIFRVCIKANVLFLSEIR